MRRLRALCEFSFEIGGRQLEHRIIKLAPMLQQAKGRAGSS